MNKIEINDSQNTNSKNSLNSQPENSAKNQSRSTSQNIKADYITQKSHKKKKKNSQKIYRKRTLARLAAIQIYYQHQFNKSQLSLSDLVKDLASNFALSMDFDEQIDQKIDANHLNQLITIAANGFENLDEEISPHLKQGWKISEIEELMLIIIKFYICEIKFLPEIAFKIIIDEYLDIAASFFENKKITFLNAIFENIAKKNRPEEYQKVKEQKNSYEQK
jgi:N utilization substance protein B